MGLVNIKETHAVTVKVDEDEDDCDPALHGLYICIQIIYIFQLTRLPRTAGSKLRQTGHDSWALL